MSRVAAQPQLVRILRPRLACRRGPDLRGRSGVWRIHGSHQRRQTRQPTWPGCASSSILDPLARVVAVSSADDAAPTPRAVRSCYISHVRGSLRHPAQSRCCVADDTCAPARSFGVFEATTLTALVTLIRLALESTPSRECASIGAITLATIASGTEITPLRGSERREIGGLSLAPSDDAQPTNHRLCCTDAAFRRFSDVVNSQPSLW